MEIIVEKVNPTNIGILGTMEARYSPYLFEPREVEDEKLIKCFESARWAASSFNDQPWSFVVARRQDDELFAKALSVLMESNQAWAKHCGALVLTVIRPSFRYNGKPNRVALHDLGQAMAHFSLQATKLGLQVHQMAGVDLQAARSTFSIPEGQEPQTAIALGYPRTNAKDDHEAALREREVKARQRAPLSELVFGGVWGQSSGWLK